MKDSDVACGGGKPPALQKLESVDWSRFAELADRWEHIRDEDGKLWWVADFQGQRLLAAGGNPE